LQKRILPLLFAVAACHASPDTNALPSFVKGAILQNTYDGRGDDLLTGGLGKTGLGSSTPPPFAKPDSPTAAELRTMAIYQNYRALVDFTPSGGYGTLYGPNVDVNGGNTLGEGKIAGKEWLAFDDDGSGRQNVTMMVQVPDSFDRNNPCIVTGTSSGSRGVYGAIATAGEWGLKHGCAVAYTDKGTGTGVQDLEADTVNLIDGTRKDARAAGADSNFTAPLGDADRAAYVAAHPGRFAVKHAHSQQNPEKDWGRFTLHAVEFAYYVLNEMFGVRQGNGKVARVYHPGQVLTIAASVSNGGGAALAAAEEDTQHFISGVVAGEPQIQVASTATIQRGGANVAASAKPLFDYTTLAALYQGCAAGASGVPANMNFLSKAQIDSRCAGLQKHGLLVATTQPEQSDEALTRLQQAGYENDSNFLHSSHFASYATPAVAVTYANAYARASVKDDLCGYSFAATDPGGTPAPANANALAQLFGNGNGVPPTGPLQLVDENSVGGPRRDQVATSPSTNAQDSNLDGMLCLRSLFTGTDSAGAPLAADLLARSNALKAGIREVLRSGRLHGVPAILVQGRADALVPVNHASRAYLGANKLAEGAGSPTFYYEVTNAQHFDAFIALFGPGFQGRFLPLHRYVIQGLDLMYAHLRTGAPLPPSQVVRTTPRGFAGPAAPDISPANVPPIAASPAPGDRIDFAGGTLSIPN
jgi:hydroxybutyrate-dimer hydrolase